MSNIKNKKENKFNSVSLSIPKYKTVCGYEIRKMPLGAYLSAVEHLRTFPEDFIEKCFPGIEADELFQRFQNINNEETLNFLLTGMLSTAPRMLLELISKLTGIELDKLINDPEIGLDGLVDILIAFAEVNRLGEMNGKLINLIQAVKRSGVIPVIGSKE